MMFVKHRCQTIVGCSVGQVTILGRFVVPSVAVDQTNMKMYKHLKLQTYWKFVLVILWEGKEITNNQN